MDINITKTKLLTFATIKSKSAFDYKVNGAILEKVTHYKYLGVFLTDNLDWKMHIDHIVSKANRSLGYLRRNLFLAPSDVRLLAYKSFILSKLEYASIIWNPWQDYLIKKIESVQNRAVRFIFRDYSFTSSVTALKTRADLVPLCNRRKVSRLTFLHRVYYYNADLKSQLLLQPHRIFPRHDHRHKIRLPLCRTKHFSESPLILAIHEWNDLPESVVDISDCAQFRSVCEELFKSV